MAPEPVRVKDRKTFRLGGAGEGRAVQGSMTPPWWAMRPENFCARHAGGCAVPDPDSFGNQAFGHATTLTWWSTNIWR